MREDRIRESGRRERHYWLALWRYRELFYVLAWRDLSVRYKQTIIVGINSTVAHHRGFYHNFRAHSQIALRRKAPYALMVFAGMLPWTLFSTGLTEASNSLVSNANLMSKVFFPRLIVPTVPSSLHSWTF